MQGGGGQARAGGKEDLRGLSNSHEGVGSNERPHLGGAPLYNDFAVGPAARVILLRIQNREGGGESEEGYAPGTTLKTQDL